MYQGLLKKDPASIEYLISAYGSSVYRLVSRILGEAGSAADIEECCSDTFTAVWSKRNQFDPQRGSLRTWLLVLARYRALDYRRHLGNRLGRECSKGFPDEGWSTVSQSVEKNPEEHFLDDESRLEVAAALASLPVSERDLLYRRYYLEESIEHIAESLGISRGAVDGRLFRARKALKNRLQGSISTSEEEVPGCEL